MFTLRFDMRAPVDGVPAMDLYAAAIDMCAWADSRGAAAVVLSEHHGADDGHLPVPLILASAIASRTKTVPILLAAVVLPLYDPVRLAEEMAVLDLISRGRIVYVFGVGHRAEEYEQFGVPMSERGRIADEHLQLVLQLLREGNAARDGRQIRVTPRPASPAGPRVMIAGGSPAAVKRAAAFGLGILAQTNSPGLKELYEAECRAHGKEPGPAQFPDPSAPSVVFVADDVDHAWTELGPYLLHDARAAAAWRTGETEVASISHATTVEELRRSAGPYRIFSPDEAFAYLASGRSLSLLPLCGGLPPDRAWRYLERALDVVERHARQPVSAPDRGGVS